MEYNPHCTFPFLKEYELKLKEKLAIRAAGKLVKKMKKEDLLIPLRDAVKNLGLIEGETQVNAAMERIEKSGFKSIFDQLGITKRDIEEVFRE